jgi:aerobic-type carbon monoxide dehydrogenase small subunit (CoxS/CutS family)
VSDRAGTTRVAFICNGSDVELEVEPSESLLVALREHLGITSAKDGCAPQGQCGCCTVLVDGSPRVACVTPLARVAGREVTTLEGLEPAVRDRLAGAFTASGGSQCGFCTPGILVRAAALEAAGKTTRADHDRALGAHLCRCTGWQSIYAALGGSASIVPTRDLDAATRRAELEGGVAQRVDPGVPVGAAAFADDHAPRDALVAVPVPPGSDVDGVTAAGIEWVVADSLGDARRAAGKLQGRRTTVDERPPLPLPDRPAGGVRLATSWVEPAYLEPDASWCAPGGEPATPLANGGAFGGKAESIAPAAARELADRLGRPVRVLFSREDVVRLGPKRPPIAASARYEHGGIAIAGAFVAGPGAAAFSEPVASPYRLAVDARWQPVEVQGPTTSSSLRAAGLAEHVLLVEGALAEAGIDRREWLTDGRGASVLLDSCAATPSGALAGGRVHLDGMSGVVTAIEVAIAAGDPLDATVLESYVVGAAHMALGWVLSEGLAVDPETGDVLDLTIRSFGVVRAKATPTIAVTIVDDPGPPRGRASDAAFSAVAAALWNALAVDAGARPEEFPARDTRAARSLRR